MSDTRRKQMLKDLINSYGMGLSDYSDFKEGQASYQGVLTDDMKQCQAVFEQAQQSQGGLAMGGLVMGGMDIYGGCMMCVNGQKLPEGCMCENCLRMRRGGLVMGGKFNFLDVLKAVGPFVPLLGLGYGNGGLVMGGNGGLVMGGNGGLVMGGNGGLVMGGESVMGPFLKKGDSNIDRSAGLVMGGEGGLVMGGQEPERKRKKSDWQKFVQNAYSKAEKKIMAKGKKKSFSNVSKYLSAIWKKSGKNYTKAMKLL